MKKIIKPFTIIIALIMSVSLAACGGETGSRGGRGTKVLSYLVSSTTDVHAQKLNEIVAKFNQEVKDEGYELQISSPGGEYYQSLGNLMRSQNSPDIFLMDGGNFAAYSRLGYMEPLDDYITASTELGLDDLWDINSYYRYERTSGVGQGKLYGLIKDWSPDFMLIYNKSMLNEYNSLSDTEDIVISDSEPLTWAEFYSIANRIQAKLGVNYGTSIGFEPNRHLMEWIQMTGSKMFLTDNENLNIDDAGVRSAFEFFSALQKDNAGISGYPQTGSKAPASYTTGASMAEQEMFRQRNTFSLFNGLWAFYTYGFDNMGFEVGIAPPPVPDKSTGVYAGSSGMIANCISSQSKYKDMAFRFLEFYMTEGMEELAEIGFNIPGNKTIANSDAFLNPADPKVKERNNYFFDFAMSGNVHPILYNPLISFNKLETHLKNQFSKYFDGELAFNTLLTNLRTQIKQEISG